MTVPLRKLRAAALLASTAILSGCLFQPGTFDATLHIQSDRQFAFEYQGEIVMAGLTQLAEMAAEAEGEEPCYNEEGSKERPCTEEELAERARDDEMGRAMMESMVGGVDMSDPEAMAEMTEMLERQAGWNSVEFVGDGTFVVDFSITSTLGHDFDFPTFENMPMSNSFVQVRLRDGNRARIEAPGFAPSAGNPLGAMMMGMFGAMSEMGEEGGENALPDIRPPEGTFRIVTDGRILTNNTDEGPSATTAGQVLTWEIGPSTVAAPAALIEFAR
ncbi:hypothetical protein OZN62_03555 [Aurantiacibacter sp. MUD11]|uniref:hypothetical protein n=1 Tax=Aurantiacibacter sp. MUD11 TaxID=3003265 RepID=UPI0022AB384B|nr:hypothetical protein [Aurantiacibacter sp. MUD11]WAT18666.1 hypothetical protein OZN62_03555 [Aurantiacibacter sp. MUD11]